MEKLELKEIVGYLPYGLKMVFESKGGRILDLTGLREAKIGKDNLLYINTPSKTYLINPFKPILFPLSSFKDINSDAMNDLNIDLYNQMELCDLANNKIHFQNCNHSTILICLENKIDVYNLIERGLAIEVTKEFNPYKL
jgi:hypothetical protein